jgi:hypothetical protein
VRLGAAAALAILGFGASFGLARVTQDSAKTGGPKQGEPASVAVLPPEAARLVRLAPGGAVPALRPPPTTVTPAPRTTVPPRTTVRTTQPPRTAPPPATTTAPPPTTYIP